MIAQINPIAELAFFKNMYYEVALVYILFKTDYHCIVPLNTTNMSYAATTENITVYNFGTISPFKVLSEYVIKEPYTLSEMNEILGR